MAKSEFPEHLRLRLTTAQRNYLDESAALHGVSASDIVRALIDYALVHKRVDDAIETIDRIAGPVKEASHADAR